MSGENLLLAFEGQVKLREAYGYSREQIYAFLKDVGENPKKYGVDPRTVPELKKIEQEILNLSLVAGNKYLADAPTLEPSQHIYRRFNRAWATPQVIPDIPRQPPNRRPPDRQRPESRTISKFYLKEHSHNREPFWNPYDLLGLFIYLIGPAPFGATKRNFFLPITAMYGQWCSKIGGSPAGGVGDMPYMFQCSWVKNPKHHRDTFFLGASLAGYETARLLTGTWHDVIAKHRFEIIRRNPLFKITEQGLDDSPLRLRFGPRGQRFGNCAETYPFSSLFSMAAADPTRKAQVHGLALRRPYLIESEYDDRLSGSVWAQVSDPCLNCIRLIQFGQQRNSNFRRLNGSTDAPP